MIEAGRVEEFVERAGELVERVLKRHTSDEHDFVSSLAGKSRDEIDTLLSERTLRAWEDINTQLVDLALELQLPKTVVELVSQKSRVRRQ